MAYTLANILADERAILDMVESEADAETALTLLDENAAALKQKAVGYSEVVAKLDSMIAECEVAAKFASEKARILGNQREALFSRLAYTMDSFGLDELPAGIHRFAWREGSWSCEVESVEALPSEYVRVKHDEVADKVALTKALKEGKQISGVRLVQGPRRLVIK